MHCEDLDDVRGRLMDRSIMLRCSNGAPAAAISVSSRSSGLRSMASVYENIQASGWGLLTPWNGYGMRRQPPASLCWRCRLVARHLAKFLDKMESKRDYTDLIHKRKISTFQTGICRLCTLVVVEHTGEEAWMRDLESVTVEVYYSRSSNSGYLRFSDKVLVISRMITLRSTSKCIRSPLLTLTSCSASASSQHIDHRANDSFHLKHSSVGKLARCL